MNGRPTCLARAATRSASRTTPRSTSTLPSSWFRWLRASRARSSSSGVRSPSSIRIWPSGFVFLRDTPSLLSPLGLGLLRTGFAVQAAELAGDLDNVDGPVLVRVLAGRRRLRRGRRGWGLLGWGGWGGGAFGGAGRRRG